MSGARKTRNSFLTRPKGEKIARAKNSGGAASGSAALELIKWSSTFFVNRQQDWKKR